MTPPPPRLAITGATGFLGKALHRHFTGRGWSVVPVSRRPLPGGIAWDPARGDLPSRDLEGVAAVIHLAGAGIADERWSDARRRELRESRVGPTALLARTLSALATRPPVLVSMSAVGIYGDRGEEPCTEDSAPGTGFLAELGQAWEAAADPARQAGIRVVHPRLGIVLSPDGGALQQMLTPFRLGAGGRLGSGRQWMSWISLGDTVTAIEHLVATRALTGPVNVTAPEPVTNAAFTATLAKVLRRPALIPVPPIVLRAMFGELADATLLAGQRVLPTRLQATGFRFAHPDLESALRDVLSR